MTPQLVEISVDDKTIQATKGQRLLWALLNADIWIPNLCALEQQEPPSGRCRLCMVQIEGYRRPVTACTTPVKAGMKIHTHSPEVDRLVHAAFEMLMSTHRLDCKRCPGNKRCELQRIAKERKFSLRPKKLRKIEPDLPIDESRQDMGFNANHCILCGKCVYVCNHEVDRAILDFTHRGMATIIKTFDGQPLAQQECQGCTRCAQVCPVGALYLINKTE